LTKQRRGRVKKKKKKKKGERRGKTDHGKEIDDVLITTNDEKFFLEELDVDLEFKIPGGRRSGNGFDG